MADPRSFPPPPMRAALERLSMFGTTALVNVVRKNVTWVLSDGDAGKLADFVIAAHVHSPPTNRAAAAYGPFVVGRVRYPYMVVLRVDDARARSDDYIGLVGDVAADLRDHVPSVPARAESGGHAPPTPSGGAPPTAAPAHAAVYVPRVGAASSA